MTGGLTTFSARRIFRFDIWIVLSSLFLYWFFFKFYFFPTYPSASPPLCCCCCCYGHLINFIFLLSHFPLSTTLTPKTSPSTNRWCSCGSRQRSQQAAVATTTTKAAPFRFLQTSCAIFCSVRHVDVAWYFDFLIFEFSFIN